MKRFDVPVSVARTTEYVVRGVPARSAYEAERMVQTMIDDGDGVEDFEEIETTTMDMCVGVVEEVTE